jgi:hypothetical protein
MSMPSSSSRPPSLSTQRPILENICDLDNAVEFARSRRSSDLLPDHPVWDVYDVGPEDESVRPDDELLGSRYGSISVRSDVSIESHRRSSSDLPRIPDLRRSTSSSRSHSATHNSDDVDQALCDSTRTSRSLASGSRDIHRCRSDSRQSFDEHFEHSIRSAESQASKADKSTHDVSDVPAHLSILPGSPGLGQQRSSTKVDPSSMTTSTTIPNGVDSSLRRSTSQRVIGFFSDLLRSSNSSRSISDQIQTPKSSASLREEQAGQKELSLEDKNAKDDHEQDVETYRNQEGDRRSRGMSLDRPSGR